MYIPTFTVVLFVLFVLFFLFCYSIYKSKREKTFVYKGNFYLVTGYCKFKHPQTGKWIDAVTYIGSRSGETYVREQEDFFMKFETLEEWEIKMKK